MIAASNRTSLVATCPKLLDDGLHALPADVRKPQDMGLLTIPRPSI